MRVGSNDPYGWGVPGDEDQNPNALQALRCADGHWLMLRGSVSDETTHIVKALPVDQALTFLSGQGVAAAQVHDGATINASPYFRARADVREVGDPQIGPVCVPGEIPKAWHEPELPLFRATRPDADRDQVLWSAKR